MHSLDAFKFWAYNPFANILQIKYCFRLINFFNVLQLRLWHVFIFSLLMIKILGWYVYFCGYEVYIFQDTPGDMFIAEDVPSDMFIFLQIHLVICLFLQICLEIIFVFADSGIWIAPAVAGIICGVLLIGSIVVTTIVCCVSHHYAFIQLLLKELLVK